MKVLVTGAAGYVGSLLTPRLLEKGYEVIALDNFMYRQTSLLDCCYHKKLTIIRGDVRNKILIKSWIKEVDVIIPLACLVGAPLCSKKPEEAKEINLDAIKLLLDLRSSNQGIVFPSSESIYGLIPSGEYGTENSPSKPVSLYGTLKVQAENMVLESGNSITLRFATAFGVSPRMRLDLLVNDFTYRAVTDKFLVLFEANFKRNFIHVRDMVKAFIHCLDNFDLMKNEPYNVGLNGVNLSKWELCEEIKKQVPDFYFIEAPIGTDMDKRNYAISNNKIEATNFKPDYTLQTGISELIKSFQILHANQFRND
jgi:nucleoside-diphosphate-sugar epimerase